MFCQENALFQPFVRLSNKPVCWKNLLAMNTFRNMRRFSSIRTLAAPMVKGIVSPKRSVPNTIKFPEYWQSGVPARTQAPYSQYAVSELPQLRKAARLARKILEFSLALAKPGITTDEIDRLAHEEMIKHAAYPSPLNYAGFPKSICTSVNDVVCHGIPDSYVLQDGDIISIDVSLYHNGYHGDNCGTVVVGSNPDPELVNLISATKQAVDEAIKVCGPGRCISEIGRSIEKVADYHGYGIVEEFCGHGTGRLLHMPPLIVHYANTERLKMVPGMVFTIEPIFVLGDSTMYTWDDKWTAATVGGDWSAQIEHEVLITDKGVEVLTVLD